MMNQKGYYQSLRSQQRKSEAMKNGLLILKNIQILQIIKIQMKEKTMIKILKKIMVEYNPRML